MKGDFYKIKWRWLLLIVPFLFFFAHPFYVSVTEIRFNDAKKTLEISCKLFSNDFEETLAKTSKQKVDLLHPQNKKETDDLVSAYIKSHLIISVNGKAFSYTYLGYEKNEDAVIVYLEATKVPKPVKMDVVNTLLYEFLSSQIGIVHTEALGQKQSSKVTNPEKDLHFDFK